jgi:protein-disulfide isomerase-like protein with CxxC motif
LKRGQFICANSPDEDERKWYDYLDQDEVFEALYDYFDKIRYRLNKGDGYFYFSRPETNAELERKIEKAYQWIDLLDFFKTYDTAFDTGFRFTPAEIHNQLKNNADLKSKLIDLSKGKSGKNRLELIRDIIKRLQNEGFVALENEDDETYKVLTSFRYLTDLIEQINIPQDIEDEIPE